MAQSGGGYSATGIRGLITPNSSLNTISLERDGVVIQTFGPGSTSYDFEDNLPINGTTYAYDIYESRTGYQTSADSGSVSGKPTTLHAAP